MKAFLTGLGVGLVLGVLLAPAAGPLRLAEPRSSIAPNREEIALLARRELALRTRRRRTFSRLRA